MHRIFSVARIVSIAVLFIYSAITLYVGLRVYEDNSDTSDAIVALGAKSYKNNVYNPCLVSRVDHAVSLYNNHIAPRIIFSGGNDAEDNTNEAETMSLIATRSGAFLPPILLEKQSTSTYENLVNVKKILEREHITSIVLVTEPFHSPRASLIARHLGIKHTVSPAISSPCWTRWKFLSRYFLKEPIAILVYWLEGKL